MSSPMSHNWSAGWQEQNWSSLAILIIDCVIDCVGCPRSWLWRKYWYWFHAAHSSDKWRNKWTSPVWFTGAPCQTLTGSQCKVEGRWGLAVALHDASEQIAKLPSRKLTTLSPFFVRTDSSSRLQPGSRVMLCCVWTCIVTGVAGLVSCLKLKNWLVARSVAGVRLTGQLPQWSWKTDWLRNNNDWSASGNSKTYWLHGQ